MIIVEQKPFSEMLALVGAAESILVVGCGTCVTVCFAGGAREATIVSASMRMATKIAGQPKQVTDVTVPRQCEWEFLEPIAAQIKEVDVVLSLGCGIGIQAIAEYFPESWIVPGLNTAFLALPLEQGVWAERCMACGDCILGLTGGICPLARCAKSFLNGLCGGSKDGHCEIDPDVPCAWQLIYDRLASLDKLNLLLAIQPQKISRPREMGDPEKLFARI